MTHSISKLIIIGTIGLVLAHGSARAEQNQASTPSQPAVTQTNDDIAVDPPAPKIPEREQDEQSEE